MLIFIEVMDSQDEKLKTCFGGDVTYTKYYEMLKNANVVNFKRDKDLVDITEHVGDLQIQHGKDMLREIQKMNMLDQDTIVRLIQMNDFVGNPYLCKISNDFADCSPNSIKYLYHGLLIVKKFIENQLQNITFVEVGSGYGGQCIILQNLCKLFNIQIKKYVLIDLDNVVNFQRKYISAYELNHNCDFLSYEGLSTYKFQENSFLFSSYSLSELTDSIRNQYYNLLLPFCSNGIIIWNNPHKEDLPKDYAEIPHNCHQVTGKIFSF